jgi:NADH-quinone oxidoreductase subunit M
MFALLMLLLCLPLVTVGLLLLLSKSTSHGVARWIALSGCLAALAVSLCLASGYNNAPANESASPGPISPKLEWRLPWLEWGTAEAPMQLQFQFGLDGVSVAMMVLTALLSVSCVLISWEAIQKREAEFYIALLLLQASLFGVFCAFDLVTFYVFFEFTLIPLFFLIAIWGGPQKRYAAVKFFLYTLSGSLITLVGVVMLISKAIAAGLPNPCSLTDLAAWLQTNPLDRSTQITLFALLSAGFLVKVPVFPFHTWLPLAHVEAPTAGSVLLAGVLLKLGSFGFLRICLPLLPVACVEVGLPLISILSLIGIVYGSFCALVQRDVKKLVAYSSVAHMGFCMLGLFAFNVEGLTGGVLQMINHGLSTGGLFLLVGMIYDRYHTRMLDDLGGLATKLPLIAVAMVFISMSSIGLPGLNGFVGEVLALAGMFKRHPLYAVIGTTGVILSAWYLLTMLQHLLFGELKEPHHADHHDHAPIKDLGIREFLAIAPIAAACLWIGVRPQPLIDTFKPELERLAAVYENTTPPAAVALRTR